MNILRDAARAFMPYPDAPVGHAPSGPLTGLTFAVKDLFDVAGYPTSGGQPFVLAMSGIKTTTAPTVQRLLDAGARFVGKTITDELAFSMNGQNAHFGSPVNGAAPDRITGAAARSRPPARAERRLGAACARGGRRATRAARPGRGGPRPCRAGRGRARWLRRDVLELSLPAGTGSVADRRRPDRSLQAAARPRRERPLRVGARGQRRAGRGSDRLSRALSRPPGRAARQRRRPRHADDARHRAARQRRRPWP